jgi:hypothetical protein
MLRFSSDPMRARPSFEAKKSRLQSASSKLLAASITTTYVCPGTNGSGLFQVRRARRRFHTCRREYRVNVVLSTSGVRYAYRPSRCRTTGMRSCYNYNSVSRLIAFSTRIARTGCGSVSVRSCHAEPQAAKMPMQTVDHVTLAAAMTCSAFYRSMGTM